MKENLSMEAKFIKGDAEARSRVSHAAITAVDSIAGKYHMGETNAKEAKKLVEETLINDIETTGTQLLQEKVLDAVEALFAKNGFGDSHIMADFQYQMEKARADEEKRLPEML